VEIHGITETLFKIKTGKFNPEDFIGETNSNNKVAYEISYNNDS
jgi:hypothetical protein